MSASLFLGVLCVYSSTQSMLISGFLPVVISSIERRYGLSSRESGFLVSWFDAVTAISAILITYFARHMHRPKVIGLGMCLFGAGCLVFTIPHVLGPEYRPILSGACVNDTRWAYWVFLVGLALTAIGTAPLYTLGTTVLYEIGPRERSSVYVGIFFTCCALGPAVGYFLGGVFLNQWVDASLNGIDVIQVRTNSTSIPPLAVINAVWVGRWWAGFVMCGVITLATSPLMLAFPSTYAAEMTAYVVADVDAGDKSGNGEGDEDDTDAAACKITETQLDDLLGGDEEDEDVLFSRPLIFVDDRGASPNVDVRDSEKGQNEDSLILRDLSPIVKENPCIGLARSLYGLMRNGSYMLTQIGIAGNGWAVVGCGTFFAKYIEQMFGVSQTISSVVVGVIVVVGAGGGTVSGGFMSKNMKLRRVASLMGMCMRIYTRACVCVC